MPEEGSSMESRVKDAIKELRKLANSGYRERMAKFGIEAENAIGVPVPEIRRLAKRMPHNAEISLSLWSTGIHEARILATMLFPPGDLTVEVASEMIGGVASWDICDHLTGNLAANSEPALIMKLIDAWAKDEREYVRRGAFSLIASVGHASMYSNENVEHYLELIKEASDDNRNFVKKSVNWALREIGKSSAENRLLAMKTAEEIASNGTRAGRWIGSSAKRELSGRKLIEKLQAKV